MEEFIEESMKPLINPTNHLHHHDHQGVKNKSCLSDHDKICKECGKGFQSWKALFGHMKCHSTKLSNKKSKNLATLNQDSWTSTPSDNENSESEKRSLKRSRSRNGRNKRCVNGSNKTGIARTSPSISTNANEQEQEVAISLMMLSKDIGESKSLREFESKDLIEKNSKMKRFEETEVGFDFLERSKVGLRKITNFGSNFDEISKFQNKNKIEHKPMLYQDQNINGYDPRRSNDHKDSSSFNLEVGSLKKKVVMLGSHECSICFRIFTSGQALGGHKRSHLIGEAKLNQENKINVVKKPDEAVRETTRGFLDLNMLPEEEEEEVNMSSSITEYKSYGWEDSSDHHSHESRMLCLFSSS